MNAYWRARWAASRSARSGYRRLRSGLRSITPFRLRHTISKLIAGRADAEKQLSACVFPPPRRYDIVCFPIIDWDFRFQRPQHLLTQFARHGHRVFYLHTTFHQAGRAPLIKDIGHNIFRVRLPGPPDLHALYQGTLSPELAEGFLKALDALRRHAGIEAAISMVSFPNWAAPAISCRQAWAWKTVYDCMDEHGGFSTSRPDQLRQEAELINDSDLVLATSRLLLERVRREARRAVLLPNAADFDHFRSPGEARPLSGLSRPIIGYYGAISEWFDVGMISAAALKERDWQFVLIGDTQGADVTPLSRLRNVYLLGELPYRSLPAYLHQFDVASIPFLIMPLTMAANPVKFYEYMSAGKPVVSVPLEELEGFKEFYYPATTGAEFVSQVKAALREDAPEKVQARRELARANTWYHRYRRLSDAIESL